MRKTLSPSCVKIYAYCDEVPGQMRCMQKRAKLGNEKRNKNLKRKHFCYSFSTFAINQAFLSEHFMQQGLQIGFQIKVSISF